MTRNPFRSGRIIGSVSIGLMLCCAGPAHAAEYYSVTDLGLPAGAEPTRPFINNSGLVAGAYVDHLSSPILVGTSWTTTPTYAYTWSAGTMTKIALPDGANTVNVEAITDAGVIGSFYDGAAHKHAFTFQNGTVTVLTPSGGIGSAATSLNAEGDVFGSFFDVGGKSHAFVFRGGSLVNLTPTGAASSLASDMTADGRVIGYYFDATNNAHAFQWQDGTRTDLVAAGATGTFAMAINAAGQIAGSYRTADNISHACVWTAGVFSDIGLPVGYTNASTASINATGELAGNCWAGDNLHRAFVWKNGTFTVIHPSNAVESFSSRVLPSGNLLGYYLDGSGHWGRFISANGAITLLNPASAQTNFVSEITEDGQIAGYYQNPGLDLHAYIYQAGTFTDFAAIGHPYGEATAINAAGDVVGDVGYDTAFVVEGGILKELNALVDSVWTVNAGWDINASGVIAAHATNSGVRRAVVLTPGTRPVTPTPTPTPPPPTPVPTASPSPTPEPPSPSPSPTTPGASSTKFPAKVQVSRTRQWLVVPVKASNTTGISSIRATLKGKGFASITKVWTQRRAASFSERWKVPISTRPRAGTIPQTALKQNLHLELRTADAARTYIVRIPR